MADDGLLMNFEIGDSPVLAKQSFLGGRWKDRFVAKKVARHHIAKISRTPPNREIFDKARHEAGVEEYIGPKAAERAPKRQRVEYVGGRNENTKAFVAGKLPPGSIEISKGQATKIQEGTRPAFISGKLPSGSINIIESRVTKFRDDTRPAFVSGKLPPGSIKTNESRVTKFQDETGTRPAIVSGKLPSGSIRIREAEGTAVNDDSRAPFVSGKLPAGSIKIPSSKDKLDWDDSLMESFADDLPQDGRTSGRSRDAPSASKPGQVVSSLFSFNPAAKTKFEDVTEEAEPVKPSNAPLNDEMATFTNLGLSTRLAAHLSTKMELKAPTGIQKAAIPPMITEDNDAFIQAETGSGKTLAYLLPIVERILAMSDGDTKVHRDSGLFAVILAPTRELCTQIATVLERLLRCAPWIVGTTIIGGKGDGAKGTERSQKARIRKGVNILIATPGRLAYHLEHTEALKVHTVRWLVLDEGDRLMELGFEDTIKGIVERIGRRTLVVDEKNGLERKALPNRRVTVLCSATMKMNVQRLGEISLKDAVHIMVDPSEEATNTKEDGTETYDRAFSAPTQLKQSYAIVPPKQRLVTLNAILKRRFARRGTVMKAIVFMSCADSVDFHFALFGRAPSDAGMSTDISSQPTKSELTKHTIAPATAFSSENNAVILHRLHGSLEQKIRTATLKAYGETTDPAVLICTDIASRGLDLPNVDYVVEYDPPFAADDHLHRVGRTARAGRDGGAFIFLLPGDEEEYVSVLASGYRDGKKSLVRHDPDEILRKGFGGTGREWEERATEWQLDVERWALESPEFLKLARSGFQSHIRAYSTHVAGERHIFNKNNLHLGHLAKSFALRDKPGSIKVPGSKPQKMTKADKEVASRRAKRGEIEKAKAPEGERERKKRKLDLDAPAVDGADAAKRMKQKMKEHMAVASEFNIG